jgi:hypothetical protein
MSSGKRAASDFEVLEGISRTATHSSAYFNNREGALGVRLYIEVDSATATPSVVFTLEVYDKYAEEYHTLLTSAAVTATGRSFLEVYPAGAATANVRATAHIGKGFRLTATHGDADAITYHVTGEWLP